jgi:hypothetical protein
MRRIVKGSAFFIFAPFFIRHGDFPVAPIPYPVWRGAARDFLDRMIFFFLPIVCGSFGDWPSRLAPIIYAPDGIRKVLFYRRSEDYFAD